MMSSPCDNHTWLPSSLDLICMECWVKLCSVGKSPPTSSSQWDQARSSDSVSHWRRNFWPCSVRGKGVSNTWLIFRSYLYPGIQT